MNCVDHLAALLAPAVHIGGLAMPAAGDIDAVIDALEGQVRAGSASRVSEDLQQEAVARFWKTPKLATLKDARRVAFGLCLPAGPGGACVLDDRLRLDAMLEAADRWLHDARWFRRCYQGLVWSYFNHDVDAEGASAATRQNWERLRDYLARRARATVDARANPDWVKTVVRNRHLFGEAPCEPHVEKLLRGDRADIDAICAKLGIVGTSWFLRRLVQAQVTAAARLDHEAFCAVLPSLIEMLRHARTLRDTGLVCLLERYAQVPQAATHEALRDATVNAWGSPWLAANALRWDGITQSARAMVSEWHKAALIDGFFGVPALGEARGDEVAGVEDGRRAAFWKRYVKSIQKIEFAFGAHALQGQQARSMRGEHAMRGLATPLRDGVPSDTALVMTMGRAVIVAFNDASAPLLGYDLRRAAPFDMARPVACEQDADNSLRQSRHDLQLPHHDGLRGWRHWEQMFEAALKDQFDIRPGAPTSADAPSFVDLSDPTDGADLRAWQMPPATDERRWHSPSAGEDVHWQTAEAASVPYSRPDLEVLARVHSLRIEDDTMRGGKLWVRTGRADPRIARVLGGWGFECVGTEGWRR